jgi:hypothetical protein
VDYQNLSDWCGERRLLGEVPPDKQGRSDRQFTRDPAIGNLLAGSAKLAHYVHLGSLTI